MPGRVCVELLKREVAITARGRQRHSKGKKEGLDKKEGEKGGTFWKRLKEEGRDRQTEREREI